jgi:CRP-like cAMP-binding protein
VPVRLPSARRAGIPTALDGLVDEALVRDVGQRPGDAHEWARGLETYLEAEGYGADEFLASLEELDDEGALGAVAAGRQPTRVQRAPRKDGAGARSSIEVGAAGPVAGPTAGALFEQLDKDPGPWGLVRLAERSANDGHLDDARAMFRAASVVFASRGLLAHALCAYDGARATLSPGDVAFDLRRLAELGSGDLTLRQQELRRVGGLSYFEALRAQTDGLDRGGAIVTPFLSALPPEAFARLGALSRIRRVPSQSYVLHEGEPGDSLFAIGEGRLVVTCTPAGADPLESDVDQDEFSERTDPGIDIKRFSGIVVAPGLEAELERLEGDRQTLERVDPDRRRVFLSALTAGDLFGEFSFLTGRPRSASVEAITSCRLVEITRRAVGGLLDEHLELKDAVAAFYKERVLEWMLAKNEVFSLLEPESRRALLSQCGVYDIPAGKVVVREGELHDAMYFIKRGEVEVSLDDGGVAVFINKLGAGEFFGEIAALEGGPRRASVRAVTDLEVFRITRDDLQIVLKDAPDVKDRLAQAMRARSAEIRRRISEQRRVLAST